MPEKIQRAVLNVTVPLRLKQFIYTEAERTNRTLDSIVEVALELLRYQAEPRRNSLIRRTKTKIFGKPRKVKP